ncbi:hypothetical protein D3C87_1636610 [compost metagenome]
MLAEAYADYEANGASWTADSAPVQSIVKLIGGDGAGTVEALNLLSFPTAQEQASEIWLGGGAVRALTESAKFLTDQKQIDKALDDYAPYVNSAYAKEAAK